MRRLAGVTGVIAVVALASSTRFVAARLVPSVEPTCSQSHDLAGSGAINCMELIPVPDLASVRGVIHLRPVPSPFGVTVRADGRPRHRLVAEFAGLPTPESLGNFRTYIAWAFTLSLDSAVKLGAVRNGEVDLGEVTKPQFRILVTAERSSDVTERGHRLVLRGTSPSARLMAHRDVVQPSAPGALRDESPHDSSAMAMPDAPNAASPGWYMPPLPSGSTRAPMMGMAALVPSTGSYLPGAGIDPATLTASRPRRVIHLANGDTLRLESGLVRRTINGKTVVMYGFNGQHPGPLIDVARGATIVVQFRNGIDQPSAIHWHGVRLDNRYDGVPGVTQDAVAPGATFTYVVRFPDAGIYWYHPHVREDVQQDLGLYGNILVRPRGEKPAHVNREQVLMLDDLLVGEHGLAAYGADSPTHALMGRFGNVMLVNGEPRYSLDVARGEVVRFYLTNVSNARLFNLSFAGARMKVVASDVGRFEREEWVSSVVLAPAERYVVDVQFVRPGRAAMVSRIQALDHMFGTFAPVVDTLGIVQVANRRVAPNYGARFADLRADSAMAAELAPLRSRFDGPPDHSLVLTMRTNGLPAIVANMLIGINAAVEWNDGMPMMNWIATAKEVAWVLRDPDTGKENMDVDWHFRAGEIVKIRVSNDPSSSHAMDHPLHLHGQRFLVVSRDGVPATNLVWKDTAIIPTGETVDLLVDMANPGRWMIHCHIAEHLGAGMMGVFTVDP